MVCSKESMVPNPEQREQNEIPGCFSFAERKPSQAMNKARSRPEIVQCLMNG